MKHLQYLNKFLWKYRNLLIIGTIFIIIANLFALYPAEFVREAFDAVLTSIKGGSEERAKIPYVLLKYSALIVSFAIFKGIFMFFMRQTIIVMSRKIEFDLKNEIYQQYQNLSMNFYKQNKTGDLMNRISEDLNKVRMYLGPALMYAINISILFYLVISKMLGISHVLTTYVLMPLPLLAGLVYFVSSNINRRSERVQKQLSQITTISQETFSGIKIIKSFGNEMNTWKEFADSCRAYTRKQIQLVKIEAAFFPIIITMIGISTILTVYIGGIESFKGNITTGNIAEFIIYVNMLAWPVASVGWITSIVQRAAASQERINHFLLLQSEIKNNSNCSTPIIGDIHFENVSLVYEDTNVTALDNVTFTIKEGTSLGIFGKTGSGKSTIANLVCRLYEANQGDVKFGKTNIKELNLFDLRSCIGYIPQDGYLFSGSIKENIAFASDKINEDYILKAAEKAEIIEEINNFNDGLNTIIGERGVKLSGGQRQRIAIGRTFYKNPKLFIFDDCLSAVDSRKEQKILSNLKTESQGKTSIIISHRTATLKDCDHIIILNEGKIIEQGTHKSLVKSKGAYYEINKNQNNSI